VKHLATLNLFRQGDGTVEITVAGGDGVMLEWNNGQPKMNLPPDAKPIDYIEELIVEAADNMARRRGA
jgi:hypothetical protein